MVYILFNLKRNNVVYIVFDPNCEWIFEYFRKSVTYTMFCPNQKESLSPLNAIVFPERNYVRKT